MCARSISICKRAGRNDTFTDRAGNIQTITYDALSRNSGFSWNDGGVTPSVTFGYDVASRITSIVNANATISHTYFNDSLLNTETTTYADNTARTVTYTYNADGNRATIQYPNGAYSFTYNYTNRNQLLSLVNNSGGGTVITYAYDPDGNLTTRTPDNGTSSTYTYDALDRVAHISHALNADTRTFDYAYDSVSNRKWTKRDSGTGDVFGYDLNDQTTATLLNVANPDTTAVGSQTINYDPNGNRTTFSAYGPTDTYTTNNLNQYTSRNSSQATYDNKGDITTGLDGSTYSYDAQNRLLSATKSGSTESFKYDGLNRQVSRKIGAASPVYNVYDGWSLIAEYQPGATTPFNAYLNGTGGLVKLMTASSSFYYYQDASGCTSHLADNTGHLKEWYRYDLQGTPIFYNSSNTQLLSSNYGIRHLFTGQQWYSDIGLYDLRNRFYSPDMGRFLQGDPSGFNGDATNLYRYCGNNPLKWSDPTGLAAPGGVQLKNGDPKEHRDDYGNANGFSSRGAGGVFDGFGGFVTNGDTGWGIYAFDQGNLGIQEANGTVFGGPANPNGFSFNGHPIYDSGSFGFIHSSDGPITVGLQGSGDEFNTLGEALTAAIDAYGTNFTTEAAGWIFRNPDGTFGYTDTMDPRNGPTISYTGPWPAGTYPVGDWHLHPANGTFSTADIVNYIANDVYGTRGFIGLANGAIQMFIPMPNPYNPFAGIVVQLRPPSH